MDQPGGQESAQYPAHEQAQQPGGPSQSGPQAQPNQAMQGGYMGQPQSPSPKSGMKWVIIVLIIIILLLGGAFVYFLMGNDEEEWTALPEPTAQEPAAVAPVPESAPAPTPTQAAPAPAPKTTTPKTNTPPAPTPAPTLGVARFEGNWKGSFTRNALADSSCSNGNSSLDISASGAVTGTITTPQGETYYGDGSVDVNGNLKGTWRYGVTTVSFSGTLSGVSGSGTYLEAKFGCFGGFNLQKGN